MAALLCLKWPERCIAMLLLQEDTLRMLQVETEREDDGRWIAEVVELPGVMAYGATRDEAVERAKALCLRTG